MRLDSERERGNIGEDTEVVGDGEYVSYAEADVGAWTLEYGRGVSAKSYSHDHPERVRIKGPFFDGEWRDVTIGVWDEVTAAIDTWDYVERAPNEVLDV